MIFPVIPNVSGVPAILRDPTAIFNALIPLTRDALDILSFFSGPQWGIFQNGSPIILADSVQRVTYKQGWSMPTYPIEQGGFETYNKVELPFEGIIRFLTGGSATDHQIMLDSIEAIAADLQLYDLVTAERVYSNCNIESYDYVRQDGKVGLLGVDIHVKEIRVNSETAFTNTKDANAAATTNTGTVQPESLTTAQTKALSGDT